MADIKRLLNKKGWTGKELGILELTNMATLFRQRISGNQNPTPLVTKGQFQKMLSSITDSAQGRIYNGYISIHEWLSLFYNIALTNEQQAQLRFKSLSSYIIEASIAEDTYSFPPLDYKSLTIPQENIDRVKQLFEDFQAFKGEESISDLMFYRIAPSEDEEGGDVDE